MLKRYFEILIVISVLFLIISFIFYTFFIDSFCNKYSNNRPLMYTDTVDKTGSCKDSLICNLTGVVVIENNYKLLDWKCTAKEISIYELDFYINKIKEIKETIF